MRRSGTKSTIHPRAGLAGAPPHTVAATLLEELAGREPAPASHPPGRSGPRNALEAHGPSAPSLPSSVAPEPGVAS